MTAPSWTVSDVRIERRDGTGAGSGSKTVRYV